METINVKLSTVGTAKASGLNDREIPTKCSAGQHFCAVRELPLLRPGSFTSFMRPCLVNTCAYAACPPIWSLQPKPKPQSEQAFQTEAKQRTVRIDKVASDFGICPQYTDSLQQSNLNLRSDCRHNNFVYAKLANSLHADSKYRQAQQQKLQTAAKDNGRSEAIQALIQEFFVTATKNDLKIRNRKEKHSKTTVREVPKQPQTKIESKVSFGEDESLKLNSEALTALKAKVDLVKYNYDALKLLKRKTFKPMKIADRDVIFGNVDVPKSVPCGWERTRLEWLLELERRYIIKARRRQLRLQMANAKKMLKDFDDDTEDNFVCFCCLPFHVQMLSCNLP